MTQKKPRAHPRVSGPRGAPREKLRPVFRRSRVSRAPETFALGRASLEYLEASFLSILSTTKEKPKVRLDDLWIPPSRIENKIPYLRTTSRDKNVGKVRMRARCFLERMRIRGGSRRNFDLESDVDCELFGMRLTHRRLMTRYVIFIFASH